MEDTRVSSRLAKALEVSPQFKVLNDHSSPGAIKAILELLQSTAKVALLTDAGTPGISDPGADLVDRCYELGIEVDAVPGPSAVTNAVVLSGFFAQRFAFLGFLPRKPGPAKKVFEPFAENSMTLVLFESPHRFKKTLEVAENVLGKRRYAICREMSKLHQQVYRDTLPSLPSDSEVPAKGEFTLVIEGARTPKNPS